LQASAYAGISPALFDRAVKDNVMPAPVRIYGRVVWDREAIDRAFARLSDGGNGETDRWDRVAV
jgi:predicted DNA-binding transcriptional regulator AlpA